MTKLTATWTKIASSEILLRSSHIIAAKNDAVYVFGGELLPRKPRDNHVHVVKLNSKQCLERLKNLVANKKTGFRAR